MISGSHTTRLLAIPRARPTVPIPSQRHSAKDINLVKNNSLKMTSSRSRRNSLKLPVIPCLNAYKTVLVKLYSTWGSTGQISLSNVTFVTIDRETIPAYAIEAVPECPSPILSLLTDGLTFKQDLEHCWHSDFIEPVVITFKVSPAPNIYAVRFMNTEVQGDTAAKKAELWIDGLPYWSGEIPASLGNVVKIDRPIGFDRIVPVPQKTRISFYSDSYGMIPQFCTDTLTFEFLDNYGHENLIGLAGIQIFGTDGKRISEAAIKEVVVTSCTQVVPFIGTKIDSEFVASFIPQTPTVIRVNFNEKEIIGFVRIYNYFMSDYPLAIGVKKLRLRVATKVVWSGKIKIGVHGHMTQVRVWFSDMETQFQKSNEGTPPLSP